MRVPDFHTLSLQSRDLCVLRDLFESRAMTGAHIAALHFNGSKEAAKKRLQKLKAAGLLIERPRRSTEPAVLHLSAKAFPLLRQHGLLNGYPSLGKAALEKRTRVSDMTLRHELEVMDVKASFHSALRGNERLSIAEFGTWPLLHQFEAPTGGLGPDILVKPDGFIRIHEKEPEGGLSEHAFFLEVDRSSETQETLITRALAYRAHYASGGFAERNGGSRSDYKDYPFVVLFVFKSRERRNNTALRLLQSNPPIFTQAYLTTREEVLADPLGAIWLTPRAYREAVQGTPFDADRPSPMREYRTETEREVLVERNANKVALF